MPDRPNASEPDDLPAPPDAKNLRSGFTTGTAATAAALCAARLLHGLGNSATVDVLLPAGDILTVAVTESVCLSASEARAVVVKDGGDDPDVTNGAAIGAIVRRRPEAGLYLLGGRGVGRVTRPGLALAPGEYAINPGPRAMLANNLAPFLGSPDLPGLEVEIFVERGEELAAHTLNPRLGIVGGLSILGSTGRVKPFSNAAYIATVESALSVARAAGYTETVLTTGRQSEKLARRARADLAEEAFVQVADFFADSLELAARFKFETVGLAVFFGKAVKQAAGHRNTHAHRHDQDTAALAEKLPGLAEATRQNIRSALTARAALEELQRAGASELVALVAEEALQQARGFVGSGPRLWMMIFDYDGQVLAKRYLDS